MVTIALIIAIPITAIVVGFLTLKSVQLGLKWQVQTANKQEPELKTPIVSAVQEHRAAANVEQNNELMKEWMFGEDGEI